MTLVLGFNCKLYRNTGSYGSPTWTLVSNCADLSLDLQFSESDVSTREGAGWEWTEPGLLSAPLTWTMIYDNAETQFDAIRTAALARTAIEFAVADGLIATAGTNYIRAVCKIFGFPLNQPLTEGCKVEIVAKPARNSDGAPSHVEVSA